MCFLLRNTLCTQWRIQRGAMGWSPPPWAVFFSFYIINYNWAGTHWKPIFHLWKSPPPLGNFRIRYWRCIYCYMNGGAITNLSGWGITNQYRIYLTSLNQLLHFKALTASKLPMIKKRLLLLSNTSPQFSSQTTS